MTPEPTAHDWPEHRHYENGQYLCKCLIDGCGAMFIALKRTQVCRVCYFKDKKENNDQRQSN